jgi:hypothetical protein
VSSGKPIDVSSYVDISLPQKFRKRVEGKNHAFTIGARDPGTANRLQREDFFFPVKQKPGGAVI